MSTFASRSLAAIAAVVVAFSSMAAVTSVPVQPTVALIAPVVA